MRILGVTVSNISRKSENHVIFNENVEFPTFSTRLF